MLQRTVFVSFLLILSTYQADLSAQEKSWMFGPFERPENQQPIIEPTDETTFDCPMTGETVQWESMATFNPAAIVKDGKIKVIYRAEEKLGDREIGGHTSRLGLAVSEDGETYVRETEPIFYPDDDGQKEYEWTGGVEDPRIVTHQLHYKNLLARFASSDRSPFSRLIWA